MSAGATIASRIDALRQGVDLALDRALPEKGAWPSTIHEAVRYSLFAGGKRVRPLLALAAGEAAGGDSSDAMPLACAVEMIHTYSLIHDDLPAMDDDDLRRGKPTCHKVFGEAIAILAGDALLTRAFHVMAEAPPSLDHRAMARRLRATAILAEACGTQGLIGGQVMDLESEGKAVGEAALERIHRAKTGALLGASVGGGAVLAGSSPEHEEALARYASAVGLAFQIVDDILDATEGADLLGKTAGKDAAAEKATYVGIHGLERSRRMARELLDLALQALSPFGERAALLGELARLIVERRA